MYSHLLNFILGEHRSCTHDLKYVTEEGVVGRLNSLWNLGLPGMVLMEWLGGGGELDMGILYFATKAIKLPQPTGISCEFS